MIKVGNLDELFTSVIYSSRCLLRYLITHPVLSYPSSSSPSSLLFSSLISLIFFTVLLLHVHFSPLSCLSCPFHLIHPLQLFVFLPLSTVSFYPSFSMILLFIALFFPPPVPSGLLSLRFSPLDCILLSSPEGKWFSSFLHFLLSLSIYPDHWCYTSSPHLHKPDRLPSFLTCKLFFQLLVLKKKQRFYM